MKSDHIAYFHVPKCSGTTVTEFFSRKFGIASVLTNTTALDYLTTPSTYFSNYKVFAGHISYDCVPLLPSDTSFVTVLRNPHSRLLSLYRYYRGLDAKLHHPQSAVEQLFPGDRGDQRFEKIAEIRLTPGASPGKTRGGQVWFFPGLSPGVS